jgi:transcriptional regulator
MAHVDVLRGTLDLLVLKALSWGQLHGYGVARWISQASREALRIEEGSLYPALYRLEERGLIEAEWGLSENNRRAKFYRLTTVGRRELRMETASWTRFAEVIFAALQAPANPLMAGNASS